jgi:hypothetical protein
MANEIFYFDSSDTGAPTLNNAAGSLIGVLDACLINGFNLKTITINVSAGVATATCNGHGFSAVTGKLVLIDGATPAALNGLKQVATVPDANTFTFAAAGVPDGAATGSITAKRAPIGWTKAFTGTNKAAYKSSDVAATGRLLRVEDTNTAPASANDARLVMYEAMTDIDTGTGPAPTAAQLANGVYWGKGSNDATAKNWVIVGDGRFFYFFGPNTSTGLHAYAFGDIISYRASDAYGCVLFGAPSAVGATSSGVTQLGAGNYNLGNSPAGSSAYLSRNNTQVGSAVLAGVVGAGTSGSAWATSGPAWPSPVDNGVVLHRPIYIAEDNSAFNYPVRGEVPGMLQFLATRPYLHREVLTNIEGYARHVLVIEHRNSSAIGRIPLDITGPWR